MSFVLYVCKFIYLSDLVHFVTFMYVCVNIMYVCYTFICNEWENVIANVIMFLSN